MFLVGWVFTLFVLALGALIYALMRLYPESLFGVLGLGPFALWQWALFAALLGAAAGGVWTAYLYGRLVAERRRLLLEKKKLAAELEECKRQHPEELPRIPDREVEA